MAEEKRTWVDELEATSANLVQRVQELLRDASATRVIICKPDGSELISLPLTAGVLVGGVLTLALPRLAALGAIAGMVTQFKLKVVRQADAQVEARTEEEEKQSFNPEPPSSPPQP